MPVDFPSTTVQLQPLALLSTDGIQVVPVKPDDNTVVVTVNSLKWVNTQEALALTCPPLSWPAARVNFCHSENLLIESAFWLKRTC
jgi:hypothetical protein